MLCALRECLNKWSFKRYYGRFVGKTLVDEPGSWYTGKSPIMWAYAGGGRLHFYGNSKEAIDDSIAHGFKIIEIDVALTADKIPVLTHWFRPNYEVQFDKRPTLTEFLSTPINGKFTALSLKQAFECYKDYKGYFSIDPWFIYREGEKFDLSNYIESITTEEQRKRIIYQVPNFEIAQQLKGRFASLHLSLPADLDAKASSWKIPYYIAALTENEVRSVSLGDREITQQTIDLVRKLRSANIHVSIAGVDSVERCWKWREVGADIVNTRLLDPAMIKEHGNG